MANTTKSFDVFLSHAIADNDVANEIVKTFESAGLATFHLNAVEAGVDVQNVLWEAMAESRALVVIVSPNNNLSHAMGLVEIGAASAWNKPIYVLVNGESTAKVSLPVQSYQVFPLTRIDDLTREIKRGIQKLSENEEDSLREIFEEMNVSVDQLFHSQKMQMDLTHQFNRKTHAQFSGERLLSELVRLRKQGLLRKQKTRA